MKEIAKIIENETKEQKGRYLGMSLATLGASLLRNMLARKGIVIVGSGNKGQGIARAAYGSKMDF